MNKPTVDVYTLCYNEEVIMPYFLKHYLSFCENIYIYDNYSTDSSLEIASQFSNVHIRKFDTNGEIRDDQYLEIKNNCWKESTADLVIVCDMDELLSHRNIVRFLKRFHSKGYTLAKPMAYDMFHQNTPTCEGQIYDEVKIASRNVFFDKMVLFNPQKITETNFYPGCHYAIYEGQVKLYKNDAGLKLLHFKYLGVDYIINKHRAYQQRLSAINKENGWGVEYDEKYEEEMKMKIVEQLRVGTVLDL